MLGQIRTLPGGRKRAGRAHKRGNQRQVAKEGTDDDREAEFDGR